MAWQRNSFWRNKHSSTEISVIFKLRIGLGFLICQQHMKRSFMLALQWDMNWKTNTKITKQSLVPTWKAVNLVCFAVCCIHMRTQNCIQKRLKLPVVCVAFCWFFGFFWKACFLFSPKNLFLWWAPIYFVCNSDSPVPLIVYRHWLWNDSSLVPVKGCVLPAT